ncbi:SRPBCC family protein [Alloalcanivorax gelatiniphagus]|uniref:SRPBCC family protein n=1 Tax=Alloalcanivorax gelatiniphagus TaxID=1194167 RepID=A0ABY2XHQ5_9GAMM|nr:SRPBCC family protein [Alloalcanivorax gelatiniphagus]TMW10800.1 SRPBCC family protein [Alloalcanivorax gelatiniphagus]|tara:strand:+ start:5090 stop:5521 length:432 start_codon:yes stop_codon:yes gene_type:complete
MGLQRIEIDKTFPFPVDRLFHHLSQHENLSELFSPIRVRRVKTGIDDPNGVGSVRRMALPLPMAPPFEETVTDFEPDQRIGYRITRGSPLRDHKGEMVFSSHGDGGSRLQYTIVFRGKLPLVGPLVKTALESSIRRGLNKLRL